MRVGLLTKIEESLSGKLGAALLVGATFSPFLRAAHATETPERLEQHQNSKVVEATREPATKNLLRPFAIVRNEAEIGKIWTKEQSVYVDKEIINRGVTPETFEKLATRLKEEMPNWTVYITTPGELYNKDPSEWRSLMNERLENIVDNQLKQLHRFNPIDQKISVSDNQSIILLCYGQGDLPTVISWAYPGEQYQKEGLNQNYWQEFISPEIGRMLAQKGSIDDALISAISIFNDAFAQRQNAASAEQAVQAIKYNELIKVNRASKDADLQLLSESLSAELPNLNHTVIDDYKAKLNTEFAKLQELIDKGEFDKASNGIQHIDTMHKATLSNAYQLKELLPIFDSTLEFLADEKERWFLDEQGLDAINTFESIVQNAKSDALLFKLDKATLIQTIDQQTAILKHEIQNDQINEMIAYGLSGIVTGVGALLLGLKACDTVPRWIDKIKWQHKNKQTEISRIKEEQDRINSELKIIGESLAEKRKFLTTHLNSTTSIDDNIDLERYASSDTPTHNYRQLMLQCHQVLQMMESIHSQALNLTSRKGGFKFGEAQNLVKDSKVTITENDGLNFLAIVKEWKIKAVQGDPHDFKRPVISFNELSKEFTKYSSAALKILDEL